MTRARRLYLLRVALSIAILVAVVRLAGWVEIGDAVARLRVEWLLALYLTTLAAQLANASMLRLLLSRVGLDVSMARVLLANALGTFYTLLLPSDVLAGVAKWADLSVATGDKPRVLSALVFAKIGLALPPLVLGTAALVSKNPFPTNELPALAAVLAASVLLAIALFFHRRSGPAVAGFLERACRPLPSALRARTLSLLRAAGELRALGAPDRLRVVALSLIAFAFGVCGMACAVTALGESVPIPALLWVGMTLFIARLIPITLSNLGVREGILVAAFGFYGVDAATAFLVGLTMFSSTLLVALVGAGYQLAIVNGWVRWRHQ